MKPKENKGANVGTYDNCQTPPYALEPLLPYLNMSRLLWECAVGKGILQTALRDEGYVVIGTDIEHNFLNTSYIDRFYTIVTNPPYSIKYEWLAKCYELGLSFALLMPVEMLGTAKGQRLFDRYGIEVIFMSPRVDFLMPHALWAGHGAQFPTAWFTWKLNLPKEMNYATINKPKRKDLPEYWKNALGEETYKESIERIVKEHIKYRDMSKEETYEFLGLNREIYDN